jgi:hypothetical protein
MHFDKAESPQDAMNIQRLLFLCPSLDVVLPLSYFSYLSPLYYFLSPRGSSKTVDQQYQ